ncbi:N-acetyltransferase family protein [Streptomyces sp. TR02-1]|uniref:GNAT family N-acetyltransferase n=1 Tax=Streptomyces sp. TR02-1 TaxID=3385977 RepID=UPI00399F4DC4
MVILRTLTTRDWPLWREARLAALTDAPHAFTSRLADWHAGGEEQWRTRMALPGAHHVVALQEGRPVGMARGVPGQDGTGELHSLWVSPHLRGHGLGDRLVAAVVAWARASDFGVLRLAVLPGNEPARALYRRHGFVPAAEPGRLLPQDDTREQLMVRRLDGPAPGTVPGSPADPRE